MTAVDDFIAKPKGFRGWLPYLQNALDELRDSIAALIGGSLTANIVYGSRSVSSAADIQLTSADSPHQAVTMTVAAKFVILGNATTLIEGRPMTVRNAGALNFGIKVFGGGSTLVAALPPGATASLKLEDDGTTAGTWGLDISLENVAVSSGSAGVYAVTFSPAPGGLVDGVRGTFKSHAAFAAEAQLNANGQGNKRLHRGGLGGRIGALDVPANVNVGVIYNSSLEGGAGAWEILSSSGGGRSFLGNQFFPTF